MPGPQGLPGIEAIVGRARHPPGRQRLAAAGLPDVRGEEDRPLPAWRPRDRACLGRPGGRRGDHWCGDHCGLGRGPGDEAEKHPPTAEEQPESEEEASAPETPSTAMPSAPLL